MDSQDELSSYEAFAAALKKLMRDRHHDAICKYLTENPDQAEDIDDLLTELTFRSPSERFLFTFIECQFLNFLADGRGGLKSANDVIGSIPDDAVDLIKISINAAVENRPYVKEHLFFKLQHQAIQRVLNPEKYEITRAVLREFVETRATSPVLVHGWAIRKKMAEISRFLVTEDPGKSILDKDAIVKPGTPACVPRINRTAKEDREKRERVEKYCNRQSRLHTVALDIYHKELEGAGITVSVDTLERSMRKVEEWLKKNPDNVPGRTRDYVLVCDGIRHRELEVREFSRDKLAKKKSKRR